MPKTHSQSKRLLLISNSALYGSGYLEHAEQEIRDVLGAIKRVLFVPFALYDLNAYENLNRATTIKTSLLT